MRKRFSHKYEIIVNLKPHASLQLIIEAHISEAVSSNPQLGSFEFLLLTIELRLWYFKGKLRCINITCVQIYIII
jgi:hypothetical protein